MKEHVRDGARAVVAHIFQETMPAAVDIGLILQSIACCRSPEDLGGCAGREEDLAIAHDGRFPRDLLIPIGWGRSTARKERAEE